MSQYVVQTGKLLTIPGNLCTSIFLCNHYLSNVLLSWQMYFILVANVNLILVSLVKLNRQCLYCSLFSFILYVWVIADRMGAKDLSRSGPNSERRRMAYGNDRRNAYDNTKAKLRYETLCHLYFVPVFCCGFLSGFALQIYTHMYFRKEIPSSSSSDSMLASSSMRSASILTSIFSTALSALVVSSSFEYMHCLLPISWIVLYVAGSVFLTL